VRTWPSTEEIKLLGFAGYKAGMTHAFVVDHRKDSAGAGKEIFTPITILECPPLMPFGIRFYKNTSDGLKTIGQTLSQNLSKDLKLKTSLPNSPSPQKDMKPDQVFVLVHTQPKSTVGKKKPEVFECAVGGNTIDDQLKYAKEILGKPLKVTDLFKPGDFIDITSVTKGKGTQGPIKRFHVTIMPRKQRVGHGRHVGSLGGRGTATRWTVPQAGQMGYNTRTEYNKRILKIGNKGDEITPKGGFVNYGTVNGDYIALKGSVPGPNKRLIRIRPALRPKTGAVEPTITYLSLTSKQGR